MMNSIISRLKNQFEKKPKKAPKKGRTRGRQYSKRWALIGSAVDSWCTYTHYLRKKLVTDATKLETFCLQIL